MLKILLRSVLLSVFSICSYTTAYAISDPATVTSYGSACKLKINWNGQKAIVYYPPNGGCAASVYSPLVIILHAAGNSPAYSYEDYDYLQLHLARNGFISASIDVVATATTATAQNTAATAVWTFVNQYLFGVWSKRFYINPSSVALIGHSRGGDTVRYLAAQLANNAVFKVRSVVSLAPVGPNNNFLTAAQTNSYLEIYGTNDGDVSPSGVYRHFDMAGSNNSQNDPTNNNQVIYKAFKLMHGAQHTGYSDLGNKSQQDTVKGYVLAFLKAHNMDNVSWYEDYIRGNAIPGGWASAVFTSYSDGFYRRVIDHFDDGELAHNTLGGSVTTYQSTAQVLALAPPNYVHQTHALWTWGSSEGAAVTWSIPAGKRDATGFKWLSLRLAQTSGAPAQDLRIQLRNGTQWSPEIRLSDYGPIAQPTQMCFIQLGGLCSLQRHMATVRVPLTAFTAYDDVQYVRIRFRGDAIPKTFIVDNLEFSEWIFKP